MIIIFLNETEGELVIDQKVICSQKKKQRPQMDHVPCTHIKTGRENNQFELSGVVYRTRTAVTAFIKSTTM